jgi:uncharacterized protein YecT (DUF1311 family)
MKPQFTVAICPLSLACCFVTSQVQAQHMNAPDAPCRGPNSNAELTACFISASRLADDRLNKTYVRILEVLSGDEIRDLRVAQRLWVKSRDANCSAEQNLYRGGSAAPTVHAACVEANTRYRTNDLKTVYGWRLEKLGKSID